MIEKRSSSNNTDAVYTLTTPVYFLGIKELPISTITKMASFRDKTLSIRFDVSRSVLNSLAKITKALKQRFGYPTSIDETGKVNSKRYHNSIDVKRIDNPKSLIPPKDDPKLDQYSITFVNNAGTQDLTLYINDSGMSLHLKDK